jgi:hypothetical protein
VEVDKADLGGLFELASGEQTGESVRALFRKLAFVPMNRTGWKVAIVNECDSMSPGAAIVWLDALEKIPGKTVLIFTTNNPNALQQRFLDRCSMLPFNATGDRVKADAERLVADVWAREGGQGRAPSLKDLGVVDRQGYVSFRRALQQLGTALLAGPVSEPATGPASSLLDRVRRGRGEGRSWKSLEVELGIPWQRLMCSLRGADAA